MNESDQRFYQLIESLEELPEHAVSMSGVFAEWGKNISGIIQKKNNWKLYDLLQYCESLPKYSVNVKRIVAEWEKKNPFVGKVIRGEASFEKTISSFATENSRLYRSSYKESVCNSPEFEKKAKEIKEKYSDILDLSDLTDSFDIRKNVRNDLKVGLMFSTVAYSVIFLVFCLLTYFTKGGNLFKYWPWMIIPTLLTTAFGSLIEFSWQKSWLKNRREHAKKILDQAWWLDNEFIELQQRRN